MEVNVTRKDYIFNTIADVSSFIEFVEKDVKAENNARCDVYCSPSLISEEDVENMLEEFNDLSDKEVLSLKVKDFGFNADGSSKSGMSFNTASLLRSFVNRSVFS